MTTRTVGSAPIGPVAVIGRFASDSAARIRALAGSDLRLVFPARLDDADIGPVLAGARYAVVKDVALTAEQYARAGDLQLVHAWGSGVDRIPLAALAERGITVLRSTGVNAATVADHTLGLMLAAMRGIGRMDAEMRRGVWQPDRYWDFARDLHGATVGLLGFGAVGQAVAERLEGFGCRVLYWRRGGAAPGRESGFRSLEVLLPEADVVSLHLPLCEATHAIIGADTLTQMKRGAFLINTARGGLVDEAALVAALDHGALAGCGLDVFADEPLCRCSDLLTRPDVVLTPHAAGRTRENFSRAIEHWAGNIRRHAAGLALVPADRIVATKNGEETR